VIDEECRWLNRRFFTYHEKKRPYIILKWAQSSDGYIDIDRSANIKNGPFWITGCSEKVLVHKWRATERSIMVGAGTIRNDNPKLNVREWVGPDPLKLILSRSGNLSGDSEVFKKNGTIIVFTENTNNGIRGAEKVIIKDYNKAAEEITNFLYMHEIESLFVEGGAEVLKHFINCGLWDEARIFYGNTLINSGLKAPEIDGTTVSEEIFSRSVLKTIANK
jgi:diaminohydroxyphosphoribosylaminopyrimidine deaminase/5-amino-6-(5-phosphoribosylamino)uracil reductase